MEEKACTDDWWVICLCADWCNVCRQWQPQFEQQARADEDVHFAWVDIEDEAHAMGDVDVETFPTVLIARGHEARFLGPITPSVPGLERLLQSLQAQAQPNALSAEAGELLRRLRDEVLPRTRL